jgi:hypothetical protein
MRSLSRLFVLMMPLCGLGACRIRESGRVDSAALHYDATGPTLHVTVVGNAGDSRAAPAREAISYWNSEFRRLNRRLQFKLDTLRANPVPDDVVRAAQSEVMFGGGPATSRLRAKLADVPGDIVIILTQADLISFSVGWRRGDKGIVAMRRADIWPLSLPNTVRNVVAHEFGHVIGLQHNSDSTTLMCGRPAPCRPIAFVSDSARFFPLTREDERYLETRWP